MKRTPKQRIGIIATMRGVTYLAHDIETRVIANSPRTLHFSSGLDHLKLMIEAETDDRGQLSGGRITDLATDDTYTIKAVDDVFVSAPDGDCLRDISISIFLFEGDDAGFRRGILRAACRQAANPNLALAA